MKKTLLITAAFGLLAVSANAGVITGWNQDNVDTDLGPYVDFTTYNSIINKADGSTNGKITWKQGDVEAPGLQVLTANETMTNKKGEEIFNPNSNCIMTTGYNPFTLADKTCTDEWQSSKRTKVQNTVTAPLDVDFDVSPGESTTYRIEQKLTNGTVSDRWTNFTIELGTRDANGDFQKSEGEDGLGFSTRRGDMFVNTNSDEQDELNLSANFAAGLSGPGDAYQGPGYFNVDERMSYYLTADEDTITGATLSATYADVFGNWVNSAGAPIAIFYDDDGDINTDNHLVANCADSDDLVHVGTHTGDDVDGLSCDGTWVTFTEGVPAVTTIDLATVYTSITAAKAAVEAGETINPVYMDYIEDAANLGLNFWITVSAEFSDNMVIRYTPVAAQ